MTNPITPPPELVDLIDSWAEAETAKKALKWAAPILRQQGADQELEACCQALCNRFASPGHQAQAVAQEMRDWLRAARRSKPPSNKKLALDALEWVDSNLDMPHLNHCNAIHAIRRALDELPND